MKSPGHADVPSRYLVAWAFLLQAEPMAALATVESAHEPASPVIAWRRCQILRADLAHGGRYHAADP